jgi:hypothetical protein
MSASERGDTTGDRGLERRGILTVALGTLLLLGGCTKVGPDFVKPDAPVAQQWSEVGELQLEATESDHADWWLLFNDPVLEKPDDSYRWPDW